MQVTSEGNISGNNGDKYMAKNDQPASVRFLAHFFSFVFHPLFIPTYVAFFLIFIHPYFFAGYDHKMKVLKLLSVVVTTAFMPSFTVFLLKQLGFIDSIYLRSQRDRIIPIVICMIFYFSIYFVSKKDAEIPVPFTQFLLAVFINSIIAQMANIKFKISLHGLAVGTVMAFFILLALHSGAWMGFYASIAILVTGIVCTSRLLLHEHNPFEVYLGLLGGVLSVIVAYWFVG